MYNDLCIQKERMYTYTHRVYIYTELNIYSLQIPPFIICSFCVSTFKWDSLEPQWLESGMPRSFLFRCALRTHGNHVQSTGLEWGKKTL